MLSVILIVNVICAALISIILASMFGDFIGFIISLPLIVTTGEIIP